MKIKGHGIVWDAEKNCILCKFNKGELETNDDRIIEVLKKGNYEFEEEPKKKVTKYKGAE